MVEYRLADAPDGFLVRRATDGDGRAFEVLLRRYSSLMRAYATRLTGSTADADDVVQNAFITAWNSLDSLQNPDAVKSWLMRVVSRKAIDLIRSRRSETPLEQWDPPAAEARTPETQAITHSQLAAIAQILNCLPELQRECWILKEIGGYSYQDIATELDAPLSTIRGALARARHTVIRGMEDWT